MRSRFSGVSEVWAAHVERWRLDHLGTIGESALRGEALAILTDLRSQRGEPTDPSMSGIQVRWMDGASESELAELRRLPASGIPGFLADWEPSSEALGPDGRDTMGQALVTVAAERARECSEHSEEFLALTEPFSSRFLDGLREGLDAGEPLAWEPLLRAIDTLTVLEEDDREYRTVTALHLVSRALTKPTSGFDPEFITPALDFTLCCLTGATEDNRSYDEGMGDPLTTGLNTLRPSAIDTAIRLAHFAKRNTDEQTNHHVERTLHALDTLFTPAHSVSLPVAAILGVMLPPLSWVAPQWVEEHAADLFSADQFGDVTAATLLIFSAQAHVLLHVMDSKIDDLIDRAVQGEDFEWPWIQGEMLVHRIGLQLTHTVIAGARPVSDPLMVKFFDELPTEVREAVLGQTGYALRSEQQLPEAVVERAQRLWELRASAVLDDPEECAELRGFPHWVESGQFSPDWWLPKLREVIEVVDLKDVLHIGEHLASAAESDPILAFHVLDRMIRRVQAPWALNRLVEYAPTIFARVRRLDDEDATDRALDLRDHLARRGHVNLLELIEEADRALDSDQE